MPTYDYVIVGAGTSGCVLASQLSRDPKCRVLLIEAGKRDRSPIFHLPKGFAFAIDNPRHAWLYEVEPFGPVDQKEQWARGKVLGGSSAINGMVYNRGTQPDWDSMPEGYRWADILPIYRAMEDHQLGASEQRGAGGPLHISIQAPGEPVDEAMIEAAGNIGLKRVEDLNASDEERIGYVPGNIKNGLRQSASKVFLKPAEKRSNLTMRLETVAKRIVLEGGRAVGVEVVSGGATQVVRADKEVILCLGNMETPKLLELSGIGRPDVLKDAGVDLRVESPMVGEEVMEHRYVTLQLRLNDPKLGYNRTLSSNSGQAKAAAKYFATRKGPIANPAYDVVGFLKSRPAAERVDCMILLTPFTQGVKPLDLTLESRPGASIIGNPLRPTTTGRQHIATGDYRANPRIFTNYDFNDSDQRIYTGMFARMREIAAQHPFVSMVFGEMSPGLAVQGDEAVINHMVLNGGTCYHAAGACSMGPDADSVVDERLRVRGVVGLRIMDASVLPVMVAGNLNAPLMAMAHRAAELIVEDA